MKNQSEAWPRTLFIFYFLALAAAISIWFIAVRSPLWLDETISFWQIHAGLAAIWSRQGDSFPIYSYILWASSHILGTSVIALRLPSICATLGAVYLEYRAAQKLFNRQIAWIAIIIFCLHPIVILESIDARPYAFALLMTTAAIATLARMSTDDSNRTAVLLGLTSAGILYFHYLFGAVLPGLLLGFFLLKCNRPRVLWRQAGIALATFTIVFLPLIPPLHYLFSTRATHVFAPTPNWQNFTRTLASERLLLLFVAAGLTRLVAALFRRAGQMRTKGAAPNLFPTFPEPNSFSDSFAVDTRRFFLCLYLALIPLLILFGISIATPLHLFVSRYRLAAIPGIALCWAILIYGLRSRWIALLLCLGLVITMAWKYYGNPIYRQHGYTWKYALACAQQHAAAQHLPVLICSDLVESNFMPMPRSVRDSSLFAPLTYYKLNAPIIPLPRAFTPEARRIAARFLKTALQRHERFLMIIFTPSSFPTLDWFVKHTLTTYRLHLLGIYDLVQVMEFIPRSKPRLPRFIPPIAVSAAHARANPS